MNTSLNDRLRQLRKILKMTQKDFSNSLNITQSYLSALEVGKRELPLDVVLKIKEEFGISTEDFLYGDITICNIKYPKEEYSIEKIEEDIKKFEEKKYDNEYQELTCEHREFTSKIIKSNRLDGVENYLEDEFATFSILLDFLEHYSIRNQTIESYALYKKGLLSREEIIHKYQDAIKIYNDFYSEFRQVQIDSLLNKLYKKMCMFDYTHDNLYHFAKEGDDLIC